MTKFMAGCLAGLLLLGAVAGVTAYLAWHWVEPLITTVTDVKDGVARLGEAVDIDRDLRHTAAFDPPASGELTPDQLTRFIAVQQQVRAALGEPGEAFAARYRELTRRAPDGAARVPSLSELLGGVADLSDVYLDAWRAQVAAMNAAGFSRAEYSWVRLRVFQAAGLDAVRYDARDLEERLEGLARDARLGVPEVTLPEGPVANRALVKPHLELVRSWLGMAFFGL
ncbi:MAG: hypothetical protein KA371_08890 [Acidobacteria bacterium]|nr:hypothetical protein [Acidobacteriota bacterium]